MYRFHLVIALLMATAVHLISAATKTTSDVQHKVKCTTSEMTVEMMLPDSVTDVYLEGMKEYGKEVGCQPTVEGNTATFRLSIVDFYRCGLTKVVDKTNGHRVYYHRIVVEKEMQQENKEVIIVKCGWVPHQQQQQQSNTTGLRAKRADELSPDFVEDEEYDITVVEGRAPEPVLGINVRQNGKVVGNDLNVTPGTLLQMYVFLDANSTSTYGLRVSYMDVTDRRTKEETIILNGCSVDPYLFENFNTVDGDTLTARFKAFKFPETNYVLFRGTIDVCLDKCSGVECSNDQIAYGRRRKRSLGNALDRKDRVFEVSMTTLVKFDSDPALNKGLLGSSEATEAKSVEQPIQSQQSQSVLNESEPQPQGVDDSSSSPASSATASTFTIFVFLSSLFFLAAAKQ